MPIFEYRCRSCGNSFERIVLNETIRVECPDCSTEEVEKLISSFAVSSGKNGQSATQACAPGGT